VSYSIRRATVGDADLLADHRARVWTEVGGWNREDLTDQVDDWAQFFRQRLGDETYIAFIAEEPEGIVIGSGAILKQLQLPRPRGRSEYSGRVQSVYVVPPARRHGVARSIMDEILAYARRYGFISLTLHPSDDGRALYKSLGFRLADEMVLNLTPE
jgi:GNAT superfamily N-acetyltransferase